MRPLIIFALCVVSAAASARPVPDIICRETHFVFIDPRTLDVKEQKSQTIYRFAAGSMFITPADRGEYLYNKVVEVEPMRYTSGHKIIQFESSGTQFDTAILVHTHRDEVRVSRAVCAKK
jgi:hypothetical protein